MVVGVDHIHLVLALVLDALVHIWLIRIEQRMDCGEQVQPGGWLQKSVENLRNSQVPAQNARKDSLAGEQVAAERAVLLVEAQVASGDMLYGRQEDTIEVSTALATGRMAVDVKVVARRKGVEGHMGSIWGRC